MHKSNKILLTIVALLVAIIFGFIIEFILFLRTPLLPANSKPIEFIVEKNVSVKILAQELAQKTTLKKPSLFVLLTYIKGATKKLEAGEYKIGPKTTPYKFLQNLIIGRVILHSFTIIPGWTFQKVISQLETNPTLRHTLKNLSDDQIMRKIGHFGETPEGRFLPETYNFKFETKDTTILKLAYNLMKTKLENAWLNRDPNVPYSCQYKTLIVASIIEKEASIPKERQIISGIIIKRLARNMYLQLCTTVRYALGLLPTEKLTKKDLKSDNPYNTYQYKGLPPTPICMPSLNSIEATLHPLATNYIYFVSKGNGSHKFSTTLKEHNRAVKRYQR